MTPNAIITVLMALGMSLEQADSSLDMFYSWYGQLPLQINHITYIWKLHNGNGIIK